MKKLLLSLLVLAPLSNQAQLLQNNDFEGAAPVSSCLSGESHTAKPERAIVVKDDGSWYYCGGVTTETDGAEGTIVVSVSSKTPSIRQTISNQVTSGDALLPNTSYRITLRIRNRGAHVNNDNYVQVSFKHIDNLTNSVVGAQLISGGDPSIVLAGNAIQIPYDSFDHTGYSTFEFAYVTPSTLDIGSDLESNGTTGNTGLANYHEGFVIQFSRAKSSSPDANDDIFIAEFSMVEDPTAGVNELTQYGVSTYPNPVTDVLHVNAEESIQNIALYNLMGQLIQSEANPNAASEIDMSPLNNGVYVLKVTINGAVGTYKVVKE